MFDTLALPVPLPLRVSLRDGVTLPLLAGVVESDGDALAVAVRDAAADAVPLPDGRLVAVPLPDAATDRVPDSEIAADCDGDAV